jgi:hypothetical protein
LDGYAGGRVKFRYRPFGNAPTAATFDPTLGETSYYEYGPDPFGFMTRPTLTASYVNGVQTARSTTSYAVICNSTSSPLVAATRHDYAGASTYLETITNFYAESSTDAFIRNKPTSIQRPDGTKQTFIYERGDWNGTTFSPNATLGLSSRITTIAGSANSSAGTLCSIYPVFRVTFDPLYLVDSKSTKTVTVRDERALVVRTESYVWVGGAWQLVSYVNYGYNFAGLLISQTANNGATSTVTYDGLLKTSETDASGITTSYLYAAAGRVTLCTRVGTGAIPTLTTRYSYDAGRGQKGSCGRGQKGSCGGGQKGSCGGEGKRGHGEGRRAKGVMGGGQKGSCVDS